MLRFAAARSTTDATQVPPRARGLHASAVFLPRLILMRKAPQSLPLRRKSASSAARHPPHGTSAFEQEVVRLKDRHGVHGPGQPLFLYSGVSMSPSSDGLPSRFLHDLANPAGIEIWTPAPGSAPP